MTWPLFQTLYRKIFFVINVWVTICVNWLPTIRSQYCVTCLPSQSSFFFVPHLLSFLQSLSYLIQSYARSSVQYWMLGLNLAAQHGFKCHCLWDVAVWVSEVLHSWHLHVFFLQPLQLWSSPNAFCLITRNLCPCHIQMKQCAIGFGEGSLSSTWGEMSAESLRWTAGTAHTWSHQRLCPWRLHQS